MAVDAHPSPTGIKKTTIATPYVAADVAKGLFRMLNS